MRQFRPGIADFQIVECAGKLPRFTVHLLAKHVKRHIRVYVAASKFKFARHGAFKYFSSLHAKHFFFIKMVNAL